MSVQIDMLLGIGAVSALAGVMVFLANRPGRRRRREMQTVLLASRRAARPAWPNHSVFISYRRADSTDIVGRLYERLTDNLGRGTVFKDVDSLCPGHDFRAQLDASLNACSVFLCVMGDRWAGPADAQDRLIDNPDDFVRIEVETALRRKIPLIPVLVHGMRMPAPDFFPASLNDIAFRHALPLRSDPDFGTDVARLLSSIVDHLESRPPPVMPERMHP